MDKLIIRGGRRLSGAVNIAGAKNAALAQIAASLLSPKALTLTNLPNVSDIHMMLRVIAHHGAQSELKAVQQTVQLKSPQIKNIDADYNTVRRMRASILVLAPLLARNGHARVSLPGGCTIGARPVDLHLQALKALGANIEIQGGIIDATAVKGLRGAPIILNFPSVGATITAMMAATYAVGETEIINAAREPEIADLAKCLCAMGAEISGAGTDHLTIQGETKWREAQHQIIPDRIEAGTYAVAAAITGGRLELTNARLEHMGATVQMLENMGVSVWPGDRGLVISGDTGLKATDITTDPYPGFPTDLQAQFMALAACADGASLIRETIFENRFMHVPELIRMGADIKLQGTSAFVRGGKKLYGAEVMATDLRASVCLVLAALAAEGQTTVHRIYHLDRGYEQLDRKLQLCGADIERVAA